MDLPAHERNLNGRSPLLTPDSLADLFATPSAAATFFPLLIPHAKPVVGGRTLVAAIAPLGASKPTIKAIEATSALKDGAAELLVTPFLPNLATDHHAALKAELLEIARAARTTRRDAHLRLAVDAACIDGLDLPAVAKVALESAFDSLQLSNVSPQHAASVKMLLPFEILQPAPELIPAYRAAGATRFCVSPD